MVAWDDGPEGIAVHVRENSTSEYTRRLQNHSLPPECAPNHRLCNLLVVGDSYVVIPAIRNLIVLPASRSSTPQIFSTDFRNCNPTSILSHLENGFDFLWVACISSNDVSKSLTYISVFLQAGGMPSLHRLSVEPLQGTQFTQFSESLLISNEHGEANLYVVSDSDVYSHPVSAGTSPHFMLGGDGDPLENCSNVSYIDHFQGSDVFTIHCFSGTVISYTTSSEHPARYHDPAVGGTPFSSFPGTDSRFPVVYKPDSVTVQSSDGSILSRINHTLGEILFGEFRSETLGVIRTDGSFYLVRTSSGDVIEIAQRVCDVEGGGLCVIPSYSSDGSRLLVYDFANSSLSVVFLLEQCVAVATLPPSSSSVIQIPSLMAFFPSAGSHACQCINTSADETPPPTTEPPTPSATGDTTAANPDLSVTDTSSELPTEGSTPTQDVTDSSDFTESSSVVPTPSTQRITGRNMTTSAGPSVKGPMFEQSRTATIVAGSVVGGVIALALLIVGFVGIPVVILVRKW